MQADFQHSNLRRNRSQWMDERGMTLVEILMTMGLLALVILGSLHLISLLSKGTAHTNQNESIANTMAHLTSAFGNDDRYCTWILGGTLLNPANSAGTQIPAIYYYDLNGKKLSSLVTLNQPVDSKTKVILSDMRLKPVSVLDSQSILANLELRFSKTGETMGSDTIHRQIPIYAVTQNGKVLTCSTSPFSNKIINNRVCSMRSDGYAHYDPIKKTCVDNDNVKWFYGTTPFSATCGFGYKPAVAPSNPDPAQVICGAEITGGLTIPPRQYSGGFTDDSLVNTWVAKVDTSKTTCTFTYVAEVDSSSYRAKIKCTLQ